MQNSYPHHQQMFANELTRNMYHIDMAGNLASQPTKAGQASRTHILILRAIISKIADAANLLIEEVARVDLYQIFSNLKSYQP